MATPRRQSYERHAHHPFRSYAAGGFAILAFILLVGDWLFGWHTGQPGAVALTLAVFALVSISRRYITNLQDRIIQLEMRLRLREVLPAAQHPQIAKLTKPQLVGLRFASDAELSALVDRAVHEQLTHRQIKQAISEWVPDWDRT
jgi:hypothetical protein